MLWTLDHLDDLESDFSAIHGIRDMLALPAPQFFRMAVRMPHYQGALRDYVEGEATRRRDHIGTAEVIPLTADLARGGLTELPGVEYVQVKTED